MTLQKIDDIEFKLREHQDFNWLNNYGKAFSVIDEKTSMFTLGAIIFDMFSETNNIKDRYKKGMFIPNKLDEFELNENVYNVLLKATSYIKKDRYNSIKEFENNFLNLLN